MPNKTQLKSLLIFNPETEGIYSIMGRMQGVVDLCENTSKLRGLVPFAETYYIITKTVALKSLAKDYFKDVEKLRILDVRFAKLFFDPLAQFVLRGICTSPWKTFFEYCQKPKGIPFLQMLLGINAHINGDLASSLASSNYKNRHDFLAINQILREEIPDVMKFLLINKHDGLGLCALAFEKLIVLAFEKIIVKWREQAWIYKDQLIQRPKQISEIHKETEKIAAELVGIFATL